MNDPAAGLLFSALADGNRRAIVERIADRGPATATGLAQELSMSRQGAAKHLSALAEAGILDARRSGREVRFGMVDGSLEAGSRWLERVGGQWDRRLAALKEHVDS